MIAWFRNWLFALLGMWLVDGGTYGQVVQLPVIRRFGVSTTVVVPDHGSVVLGGVNRYREASSRFGLWGPFVPGNRSSGFEAQSSGVSVNATIIDHDEWDRRLLAEGRFDSSAEENGPSRSGVAQIHMRAARDSAPVPMDQIVVEQQRQKEAASQEARGLFDHAQVLATAGRMAAAKHYFRLALKQADEPLRLEIQQELARLKLDTQPH